MDVLTPRSLDEALRLRADVPGARPIEGGTDLMVELNFDRTRPDAFLNLNEVGDLKGWSRGQGSVRLGAGLTFTEAMNARMATLLPALAEASRTVGSPQIRNRGTIGGNLGTASPAGDALPPLLVAGAEVEVASAARGNTLPLHEFLTGPQAERARARQLIVAVNVPVSGAARTFMKVGPRNAMW
jgi:CO/xanthine dehydrogenase FAD-binding subunit